MGAHRHGPPRCVANLCKALLATRNASDPTLIQSITGAMERNGSGAPRPIRFLAQGGAVGCQTRSTEVPLPFAQTRGTIRACQRAGSNAMRVQAVAWALGERQQKEGGRVPRSVSRPAGSESVTTLPPQPGASRQKPAGLRALRRVETTPRAFKARAV